MHDYIESHKKRSFPIAFWLKIYDTDSATGCGRTSQYSCQWLWFWCFSWLCQRICLLIFDFGLRSRCTCPKSNWNQKFWRDHILDDCKVHGWTTCTWECRACCVFFFCPGSFTDLLTLRIVLIMVSMCIALECGCWLFDFTRYCYWRNNGSTSYNHSIDAYFWLFWVFDTNFCELKKNLNLVLCPVWCQG
jgi:hypothetical protein